LKEKRQNIKTCAKKKRRSVYYIYKIRYTNAIIKRTFLKADDIHPDLAYILQLEKKQSTYV